jgi:hypothetical protein
VHFFFIPLFSTCYLHFLSEYGARGGWMSWCSENLPISYQEAQLRMRFSILKDVVPDIVYCGLSWTTFNVNMVHLTNYFTSTDVRTRINSVSVWVWCVCGCVCVWMCGACGGVWCVCPPARARARARALPPFTLPPRTHTHLLYRVTRLQPSANCSFMELLRRRLPSL